MAQDDVSRMRALLSRMTIVRDEAAVAALLARMAADASVRPVRVAFVNAHAMNLCWSDEIFYADIMACDYILRDGAGMKILFKMIGEEPGLNLNGTDLIPKMLALYQGKRAALMGTASPWLEKAADAVREKGCEPVLTLDGFQDIAAYPAALKDKPGDIVILAMGMPKQEHVARKLAEAMPDAPMLIVNGGAILDFMAGKVRRAPEFFRKTGLEWVYRLAQEPKRLFKRYVIGNGVFLAHALRIASSKPAAETDETGMKKVKILHVVRQFHPAIGGLESYVLSMAKHQRAQGYAPEILTLNQVFHGDGKILPASDTVEGLPVHRVGFFGKRRFFIPKVSPFFFRKYDIVHVHNTDMFYDYTALVSGILGIPAFATTHGGFFHTKDFSLFKTVYFNVITRMTSIFYRAIFAISQNDYDTFKGLNRNVVLQHNAVEPLGEAISEGRDFLYIGRLAAHKNVGNVIRTCAALFKDHGVAGDLHIVGPAWDVSIEELRKIAEAEGIADRVIFHGAATREDMIGAAAKCGYFVSGSSFEGFGMSMLEGMSVGMIPFVQPNESFKELVGQAGVGLCVDFAEAKTAAAKIMPVLQSVTDQDRRKAQGFALQFAWQGLVENAARVYEERGAFSA